MAAQVAMLDVFAAILDNSFKTLTPFKYSQRFIDDSINEENEFTVREFTAQQLILY